jgi:hypothetical protein
MIMAALLSGPFFIATTFGQGLYLGLGGGLHFPAARQATSPDENRTITSTGSTTELTSRSVSLGRGIHAGLYAGYMFNKNVGAEIGFNYVMGGKTTIKDDDASPTSSTKSETTMQANMIRVVPAIRMTAGEGKLRPYMRMGLILGLGTKLVVEDKSTYTSPADVIVSEETWEYKGGMSLGFHGGLGAIFMISDGLGIFAEVAGNFQSWAPATGSMTKSMFDGEDQMPDLKTNDKEIEYVDSFTITSPSPTNDAAPSQQLRDYHPFSSVGINIGIHFTLGGGGASASK